MNVAAANTTIAKVGVNAAVTRHPTNRRPSDRGMRVHAVVGANSGVEVPPCVLRPVTQSEAII
jgi:hypothetical protein